MTQTEISLDWHADSGNRVLWRDLGQLMRLVAHGERRAQQGEHAVDRSSAYAGPTGVWQ